MPVKRKVGIFLLGFTLIELLIIVAIIGILAAIAIPNFLHAQLSTKIARMKSEFSSCQSALEGYYMDHNMYPDYDLNEPEFVIRYMYRRAPNMADDEIHFLPRRLTTPTNYLPVLHTDFFLKDYYGDMRYPFQYYNRRQSPEYFEMWEMSIFGRKTSYEYFIASSGPNIVWDYYEGHGMVLYDPTNGIVSVGDILLFGP